MGWSLEINIPRNKRYFKRAPKFDENQASVTGNTEEEENAEKKATDNVDENAEVNEIIHKDKEIFFTIQE